MVTCDVNIISGKETEVNLVEIQAGHHVGVVVSQQIHLVSLPTYSL